MRRKKKKEEDILKYKTPTHNITWFHLSGRSCVSPQEKGEEPY